jgi:hypothetical protein
MMAEMNLTGRVESIGAGVPCGVLEVAGTGQRAVLREMAANFPSRMPGMTAGTPVPRGCQIVSLGKICRERWSGGGVVRGGSVVGLETRRSMKKRR